VPRSIVPDVTGDLSTDAPGDRLTGLFGGAAAAVPGFTGNRVTGKPQAFAMLPVRTAAAAVAEAWDRLVATMSSVAASSTPFKVARTGTRYATLAQAVAGAISTDTIQVAPGTYFISDFGDNDPGMTRIPGGINLHTLTIEWEVPGNMPIIDLSAFARRDGLSGRTVALEAGPDSRNLTVRGICLIGDPEFGDPYGINTNQGYLPGVGFNGNPPSTLTVDQCKLVRWADGLKTTIYNKEITLNVTSTVIEDCTANSLTHGIYTANIAALNVRGCTFRTTYPKMQVSITGALSVGQAITSSGFGSGVIKAVNGSEVTYRLDSGDFSVGNEVRVGGVSQGTVSAVLKTGLKPPANNAGHLIKSRARVTVVEGSLFDPVAGCATCIEKPSGGTLTATGNIVLHYGQPSSSDDNPPIKYGFEESARKITLSVSGTMPTVGQTITNGSATATVYAVSGGNTIVYNMTAGTGLYGVGNTISLSGGAVIGTVMASSGSPDGSSQDGRTHSITVAQNTVRKDQPGNWSGSNGTAIGMMWVAGNMTLDDGTALPRASIPRIVENNLVGDTGCGNKTLNDAADGSESYPNNSVVARGTISDPGVHSGAEIDCSPLVQRAAWAWAGDLLAALARTSDLKRGGRALGLPAWRLGMEAFTWKAVGTTGIASVDPAASALYNPAGAGGASPWRGSNGQHAVIHAWGSAVWDKINRKLWIPIGGGHGNYAGNECYRQDMAAAVPPWTMPRPPSGAIGNTITLDDGLELTGAYSDGRPRSPHVYNNVAFADGVGPVIVRIGAPFADSNKPTHKVFSLDPNTGETTLRFDFADAASVGFPSGFPGGTGPGSANNGCCCYVPARSGNPARIYSVGTGNNTYLFYVEPTNTPGMWSGGRAGSVYLSEGRQGMVYVPTIDRILWFTTYLGTVQHKIVNIDTGAVTDLGAVAGSLASGFNVDLMCGGDWCPELNGLVMWNQDTNRTQPTLLTPSATPLTTAWTASAMTVGGSNTVTPPVKPEQGVFGLWRYDQSLRGFFLICDEAQPTHFFAIANIG
jgi:hypothetical protein